MSCHISKPIILKILDLVILNISLIKITITLISSVGGALVCLSQSLWHLLKEGGVKLKMLYLQELTVVILWLRTF